MTEKTLIKLSPIVIAMLLSACSKEESGPSAETLTATTVNNLLAASEIHGERYLLDCSADAMQGCFVIPGCDNKSQSFSTKMVISLKDETIDAFKLYYENDNCGGGPTLHPTDWSRWIYEFESVNRDSGEGELNLLLERYQDSYVFDHNKPTKDVVYLSKIWVDSNGSTKRLCLSDDLIDPSRPLKFMSTGESAPLDTNDCAEELPN